MIEFKSHSTVGSGGHTTFNGLSKSFHYLQAIFPGTSEVLTLFVLRFYFTPPFLWYLMIFGREFWRGYTTVSSQVSPQSTVSESDRSRVDDYTLVLYSLQC